MRLGGGEATDVRYDFGGGDAGDGGRNKCTLSPLFKRLVVATVVLFGSVFG